MNQYTNESEERNTKRFNPRRKYVHVDLKTTSLLSSGLNRLVFLSSDSLVIQVFPLKKLLHIIAILLFLSLSQSLNAETITYQSGP